MINSTAEDMCWGTTFLYGTG